MALKDWGFLRNEKDYKVWENNKTKKRISIYRNIFTTPSGRQYNKKTQPQAMNAAKNYMRTH